MRKAITDIPQTGDDILDLPPLQPADLIDVPEELFEPPYKHQIIEYLTSMLIDAENNEVYSFLMLYEFEPGKYAVCASGCDNASEQSGKLLELAIKRLGFAWTSQIKQFPDEQND